MVLISAFGLTDLPLVDPEEYKIISECDVLTMINSLSHFGLEVHIPSFIEIVLKNEQADIPEFKFFLKISIFL